MRPGLLLPLVALLGSASGMLGQPTPAQRHTPIFGTYSSLLFEAKETGDIVGAELTVIPQYIKAYVLFQCAEGSPSLPLLVPATVTPSTVDFTIPNSSDAMCSGSYHGVLTAQGLRLSHAGDVELIPRRKSYWAR